MHETIEHPEYSSTRFHDTSRRGKRNDSWLVYLTHRVPNGLCKLPCAALFLTDSTSNQEVAAQELAGVG
eukprot:3178604-Pyramimonas_sp.AAC.1